ncbi:MAG: S8 family serine peptidase [Myxococcales bacterium]|nr:S8 family serine peptidase [Myxococcales bacterium]
MPVADYRSALPLLLSVSISCAASTEGEIGGAAANHLMIEAPDTDQPDVYRHPLRFAQQMAGLSDDQVPGLGDAKNSPEGLRYAVGVRLWSEAEGAPSQHASGLVPVVRRAISRQEMERRWRNADPRDLMQAELAQGGRKIGESLQARLDTISPPDDAEKPGARDADAPMLEVAVRLARPDVESLTTQLQRAVGRGEVDTRDDLGAVRSRLLAQKRAHIARLQAPVAAAIRSQGGKVELLENMWGLNATLPARFVPELAARQDVARVDLHVRLQPDFAGIDGIDVANGSQITQYNAAGWDGERGLGTLDDVTVAVVETCGIDDEHPGFTEPSAPRLRGRFICEPDCQSLTGCSYSGSGCCSCDNFDEAHELNCSAHASNVAGLLLGDLTDNQDPNFPGFGTTDQRDRSGYANEARAYIYDVQPGEELGPTLIQAFSHMLGRIPEPSIANLSGGPKPEPVVDADDPFCLGQSVLSRAANDLYEDGILLIKSAGNEEHDVANDCRLTSPAAAIGAFTVGAHTNFVDFQTAGESAVRNDDIGYFSSRGGTDTEGAGRSIIDITAYGCRNVLFDADGGYYTYTGDFGDYIPCGTSYSAPTVGALAVDLTDWWRTNLDNAIEDPGLLYVNLLLMGDREGPSGEMDSGFDGLWGGGRLKARKWDAYGMDSPWYAEAYSVCVDHGETVEFPLNFGLPLPLDVDVAKAVIYWYDRHHELGTAIDNIDLALVRADTGTPLRESNSITDNKERVFYEDPGGLPLRVEISGTSVTSDLSGCGFNSQRVYYAFFYEDSDRDDFEGPYASEVEPE